MTPEAMERQVQQNTNDILDIYAMLTDISQTVKAHDLRFDAVDGRFDGIDARFDGIDTRLDGIDTRFDGVDAQLTEMLAILKETR